jgi:hypothetical protein
MIGCFLQLIIEICFDKLEVNIPHEFLLVDDGLTFFSSEESCVFTWYGFWFYGSEVKHHAFNV